MDEAAGVTTGVKGVSIAAKGLGGLAGGIGMVSAGMDMAENGPNLKNGTQMVLSAISVAAVIFPVLAPVAIAAGIVNLAIEYGTH